ncbi:MAG: ATP-binding protein, partial [Lachnospiraceae bacterium]|nr:ATP-binding protein [Lachnospiraceae bacterium]
EIDIDSFRGIDSLKLSNLAQINILTGDNNCGKTSVLEVLESFRQPDDMIMWDSLTRRYVYGRTGISSYEGIYNLFNINLDEKKIQYTLKTKDKDITLMIYAKELKEQLLETEYYKLIGYSSRNLYDNKEEIESNIEVSKLEIEIKLNERVIENKVIYEGQNSILRGVIKRNLELRQNIVYISPMHHVTGNIFLSEVLDNPELYEEMLTILKEYDEDIISINYDNNRMGNGVYKILSKSHKKALPLNVYGDGMKKAVLLMSAVVKAKDGVLLLDEFETAIHTSAMKQTFKWILETCKKLNVQVFMTSHSKEAIDKVLKCAPDLWNDMAIYTLYKNDTKMSVRRLDAIKAIEVQDEMGLELR